MSKFGIDDVEKYVPLHAIRGISIRDIIIYLSYIYHFFRYEAFLLI